VPPFPEDRRQSPRLDVNLQARLEFSVLMREADAKQSGVQHLRACAGYTMNISQHGLALVLQAQNIDEEYLTGGEGSMAIELDLPNGLSLEIQATPVRYEKLEDGYMIGARISSMTPRNRELFDEYLEEIGAEESSTDYADSTD
jgi:PilZ domain